MQQIDHYRVAEILQESSCYVVYRGFDAETNRPVLIKQLKSDCSTGIHKQRLVHDYEINRELTLTAGTSTDYLELKTDSPQPYIVMADAGGVSLRKYIQHTAISTSDFLSISIKIIDVLALLHQNNKIHNSISPDIIYIQPVHREIQLIDFSFANSFSKNSRHFKDLLTDPSFALYISPEQTGRTNRSVDYRTDFYSLGAVFYEMLTGMPPFHGDISALLYSHLARIPEKPCNHNPEISAILSDMIMKLLEKMSEKRYQSSRGLKYDLEHCMNSLTSKNEIPDFAIASMDLSYRFNIPQKMYGREKELQKLHATFENVMKGNVEVVTVSGYSGIGKSTLVNELRGIVIENRGIFAMGKNELLVQTKSFFSITQAFENIISYISSEDKDSLMRWKGLLVENLSQNASLLIEFVPALARLIEPGSKPQSLPSNEAYTRLLLSFSRFISTFAHPSHPLVLLLDDMQWSDPATLRLLELLIKDKLLSHIMIVLSYRDNEVINTHPFMLTLGSIRNNVQHITEIHLAELSLADVNKLIGETLHLPEHTVAALAELCLEKTAGNPFFLIQFVNYLYDNHLIWFDINRQSWAFSLEQIEALGITVNVLELLLLKIKKLPADLQNLLSYAACIGNRFTLELLSMISGISSEFVEQLIGTAVSAYLIRPVEESSNDLIPSMIYYVFLHDRIHQAFYVLWDEDQIRRTHLTIGRLLFQKLTEDQFQNGKAHEILNHYNMALKLITEDEEKNTISNLQLYAAIDSKRAGAYDLALTYINSGILLLPLDHWKDQYQLSLQLYTELTEVSYLLGNQSQMETTVASICKHVRKEEDSIAALKYIVISYASAGNTAKALDTSIDILQKLGIKVHRHPTKIHILYNLLKTQTRFFLMPRDRFQTLPFIQNLNKINMLDIFALIGSLTYRTDSLFMSYVLLLSLQQTIKFGYSHSSPFFLSGYGLFRCATGNIEDGYEYSKLSMEVIEKYDLQDQKAKAIFINNTFVNHWNEPIYRLLDRFRDGYESGLQCGDYEFAAYNGFYYCNKSFYAGKNLEILDGEMDFFTNSIRRLNQPLSLYLTQLMHQAVYNLQGRNADPEKLTGEYYDEEVMLAIHQNDMDLTAECSIYIVKSILSTFFNQYEHAELYIEKTGMYIDSLRSTYASGIYYFYRAMAKLGVFNVSLKSKRQFILQDVDSILKRISKWIKICPENYENKYYLILAEKNRAMNNPIPAAKYYDKAITSSEQHGFVQEAALCSELAANFYHETGNLSLARYYLINALNLYKKWGGYGKVQQLVQNSEIFRQMPLMQDELSHIISQSQETFPGLSNDNEIQTDQIIDSTTIIKASQALSEIIKLDELLKTLMEILLQNSGAQRIVYTRIQHEQAIVIAVGTDALIDIDFHNKKNTDAANFLPQKIINYVINTQKPIVIDEIDRNMNFYEDIYFRTHKPKSILGLPVISKNELKGLLYFENNLIHGAFNNERIQVLQVLSSQMSISIDNATMVQNLEHLNNTLEQKVNRRTLILNQTVDKVYMLLDHSGEGFLTFDYNFIVEYEFSRECVLIFNRKPGGISILELLFELQSEEAKRFKSNVLLAINTTDTYKRGLILSLLPSSFLIQGKNVRVRYNVLENRRVLLVITDITKEVELESKVQKEQERLKLIVSTVSDRENVNELLREFRSFLDTDPSQEQLLQPDLYEMYRSIHTFKGNFAQYHFTCLPAALEKMEFLLREQLGSMSAGSTIPKIRVDRQVLSQALKLDLQMIESALGKDFLSDSQDQEIRLSTAQVNILKQALDNTEIDPNDVNYSRILSAKKIMNSLRYRNLKSMLSGYTKYSIALATRMNKSIQEFSIEGDDVLVDPELYNPFVKSLVHLFRNAVDHGIETPDERTALSKPEQGILQCNIKQDAQSIQFTMEDDGRGLDANKIIEKAIDMKLLEFSKETMFSEQEAFRLIFKHGFSTSETISDISGHGVGLSAVLTEIEKLGGSIDIISHPRSGTKFTIRIPKQLENTKCSEEKTMSNYTKDQKKCIIKSESDGNRLFDSLIQRTCSFMIDEIHLKINRMPNSMTTFVANEIELNPLSSSIIIEDCNNTTILFSFETPLIQEIFRRYTKDLDIVSNMSDYLMKETCGDIINIVIGNVLSDFELPGYAFAITPPMILTDQYYVMKKSVRKVYTIILTTDFGLMSLYCILHEEPSNIELKEKLHEKA